jgi:hypothetical protein
VPDGAVGHDVAAGALPSDIAALELLLVQRRVHATLAQQRLVGAGFDHTPASMTLMTSAFTMVDRRWAMAMVVRDPIRVSRAFWTSRSLAVSRAEVASSRIRMRGSCPSLKDLGRSPPKSHSRGTARTGIAGAAGPLWSFRPIP